MVQPQKSKTNSTLSSNDEKLAYEQKIKLNLSTEEKALILKYLEKLSILEQYRVIT